MNVEEFLILRSRYLHRYCHGVRKLLESLAWTNLNFKSLEIISMAITWIMTEGEVVNKYMLI